MRHWNLQARDVNYKMKVRPDTETASETRRKEREKKETGEKEENKKARGIVLRRSERVAIVSLTSGKIRDGVTSAACNSVIVTRDRRALLPLFPVLSRETGQENHPSNEKEAGPGSFTTG